MELIATVDLRVAGYGDVSAFSTFSLVAASFKLILLYLLYRSLNRQQVSPLGAEILLPSLQMVLAGYFILIAFHFISTALAFRFYEFFDSFSVFIVAAALMQRRAALVLAALAYCAVGFTLQALPGLFFEYQIAPWSRYAG
jgi:hypothetical protein